MLTIGQNNPSKANVCGRNYVKISGNLLPVASPSTTSHCHFFFQKQKRSRQPPKRFLRVKEAVCDFPNLEKAFLGPKTWCDHFWPPKDLRRPEEATDSLSGPHSTSREWQQVRGGCISMWGDGTPGGVPQGVHPLPGTTLIKMPIYCSNCAGLIEENGSISSATTNTNSGTDPVLSPKPPAEDHFCLLWNPLHFFSKALD